MEFKGSISFSARCLFKVLAYHDNSFSALRFASHLHNISFMIMYIAWIMFGNGTITRSRLQPLLQTISLHLQPWTYDKRILQITKQVGIILRSQTTLWIIKLTDTTSPNCSVATVTVYMMNIECYTGDMASIHHLPDEVLEQIFEYLCPYRDYHNCNLVCSYWRKLIHGMLQPIDCYFIFC